MAHIGHAFHLHCFASARRINPPVYQSTMLVHEKASGRHWCIIPVTIIQIPLAPSSAAKSRRNKHFAPQLSCSFAITITSLLTTLFIIKKRSAGLQFESMFELRQTIVCRSSTHLSPSFVNTSNLQRVVLMIMYDETYP